MSGAFSAPKNTKSQVPQQTEDVKTITEDEDEVKRRKRASLKNRGRAENILSGIQTALKKRLGE